MSGTIRGIVQGLNERRIELERKRGRGRSFNVSDRRTKAAVEVEAVRQASGRMPQLQFISKTKRIAANGTTSRERKAGLWGFVMKDGSRGEEFNKEQGNPSISEQVRKPRRKKGTPLSKVAADHLGGGGSKKIESYRL